MPPERASARRIGGNAVNHPGRADRAHRGADEGVLAGIVLVDLEVAGGILHQHLVLARGAERAKADDMEVAADRPHLMCRSSELVAAL